MKTENRPRDSKLSANGQLLSSELALIPGTMQYIYKPLVGQVTALRQAFAHRFGKPLQVTDGYRSYAAQERLFRARYTTTYLAGRPSKVWLGRRWYQRPYTAMAAVPGTSNHGLGVAMDLGSGVNIKGSAEHNWVVANAPTFGFRWPSEWARSAGEWWHFEDGRVVSVNNYVNFPGVNLPGVTPTPTPVPPSPVTPPSTATLDKFIQENSMHEIIESFYRKFLGRNPSQTEKDDWTNVAVESSLLHVRNLIGGSNEAKMWRVQLFYIQHLGRRETSNWLIDWIINTGGAGQDWKSVPVDKINYTAIEQKLIASAEAVAFRALPEAERNKRIAAARAIV